MAVIVTDNRTTITQADATTGFNQGSARTEDFAEAPACVGIANNIGQEEIYFTGGTQNLTNSLIYVYLFNNAIQEPWTGTSDPPIALVIGDGTNRISIRQAGANRRVFNQYNLGPVNWQCCLVDTAEITNLNNAGLIVTRAGSVGGLNVSALTQFGGDFDTLSKALAGGYNNAVDIIRVGNNGITITGGTTGDRGNFLEIVVEDRSTASGKAHGIIREYTTGIYGAQGPLTFGNTTATSWFEQANATLAFEDRFVANDKYYLSVIGGTGETHFILRNSSITTAGSFVRCDFDSDDIDELVIQNNAFSGLGNEITFAGDLLSEDHIVIGNTFNQIGQIDPGLTEFENNTISNSTNADGALILNHPDRDFLINVSFNAGAEGHAILLGSDVPDELTFTGVTYSGYGADDTTDAALYNNSGKAVTIFLVGGSDVPTVRNGTGASTTIIAAVNVTVTGLRDDTEVRVYPAGMPGSDELAGIETATDGDPDDRFFTFTLQAGTAIDIQIVNLIYEIERIENFIVPTADTSIPIQQRFDRNYISGT